MCLTRVLVPHRLPHRIGRGTAGFRGGLHVESGGEVSGERGALPVDAPSPDVDSRCRYRWSTSAEGSCRSGLSASSYATRSTRRSNNEGREAPRDIASPRNRGFRGDREAKGIASLTQLRAGRQGRDPDRENSLPP